MALILCFGLGFNGLQTYNMASAIDYYVIEGHETVVNAIIGLFVVVAVAVVIFGGVHRISVITSWVVPIMAGAYILIAIWTCVSNLGDVPAALGLVFGQAFDFSSLAGGFTGSMIHVGIKRTVSSRTRRAWDRPRTLRQRPMCRTLSSRASSRVSPSISIRS